MCKLKIITIKVISILTFSYSFAQEQIAYKHIETTTLVMEMFTPSIFDKTEKHPAIIFLFGGGWNEGSIKQFEPHAKYFANRGLICFLVDYRVKKRHNSTPFESLMDAKSAIRFVREYANQFLVDANKIIASGGSAGGQLAAACALIEGYNESTDNLDISCKPNALVLFNPAIDNGPGGVGFERIGNQYKDFSPLHNIKKDAPPTIIFLGTDDYLIPVETAKYYQTIMNKVGSVCELHLYEGKGHGFFNFRHKEDFESTVDKADKFLQSLGYLLPN